MMRSSASREMWTMRREHTKRYSATKSLSATDCDLSHVDSSSSARREEAHLHRVATDAGHAELGTEEFTVDAEGVSSESSRS
jgi:hypothetical protein